MAAFPASPAVTFTETDLTTVVPNVSTTNGGFAGLFTWGPIGEVTLIPNETILGQTFGLPSDFNGETWFTAADFLAYGAPLYLARAGQVTGNTVSVTAGNSTSNSLISGNSIISNVADTSNLSIGQVLLFSSATGAFSLAPSNPVTITSLSSTSITLSQPASISTNVASFVFRDSYVQCAIGQQTPLNSNIHWSDYNIPNSTSYTNFTPNLSDGVLYIAKYPGAKGNSLRVAVCDTANQFSSSLDLLMTANGVANAWINATTTGVTGVVGSNTITITIQAADTTNSTMTALAANIAATANASLASGDLVRVGNSTIGYQYMSVVSAAISGTSGNGASTVDVISSDTYRLGVNTTSTTLNRYWEFFNLMGTPPGTSPYVQSFGNNAAVDEMHIVVVDDQGAFTNVPGAVLETYKGLSRATDAKAVDGGTNYYASVLNTQSKYIWWSTDRTQAVSNTAAFITSSTATAPLDLTFYGGSDGPDESTVPLGPMLTAYNLFASAETVDISLLMQGKAIGSVFDQNNDLGNYLIQSIAEIRKDCVAFVSPPSTAVVNVPGQELTNVLAWRADGPSSSYGFADTGYYYRYDRYNDVYRWIPLNGQMAGLCARCDQTNAPWWSPAGINRGILLNVTKLAYNPIQADRDVLYPNSVNPVITLRDTGTVLYGDTTMLNQSSAFNRINVRRLFIVLEKAISQMSQTFLFEFNDDFTQARFKAIVIPYLQTIQGQRGITDFLVVCDATNNTPEVVDENGFVGDIYLKPARSINFIQLNFVAVSDEVSFSEVVGLTGQQ